MLKDDAPPPAFASALASLLLAVTLWPATAAAGQPSEPNGLLIPQPISADVPYQTSSNSLTLAALFVSRGEAIDWQMDATTAPAVFSPNCGFTGTLVLRGGGCKVDFGWYNADPSSTTPPPDSQIYVLVPQTDPIFNNTFQPQVGQTGNVFSAASIQSDPNYQGGLIGFAIKGNPSQACSQTHYSEQKYNVTCTNCTPTAPWITALIWKSTKTPNAYYVGFEDLPMAPTSFQGFPGQQYVNDGDFNDFVYFITGIDCAGAGKPCDTGKMGACAQGLTNCSAGATMTCQQQTPSSAEKCDGIDNDCNGQIDDGNGLCPVGEVCDHGKCVGSCGGTEFPCPPQLVCNAAGYCVESACLSVTCPAGQVCHGGTCAGPCDGVVCPKGQTCSPGLGQCVDPCASVTCGAGQVCDGGACILACTCKGCGSGTVCVQSSGRCVDAACATMTCPTGTVCSGGACVDACQGAICPGGVACMNGQCATPVGSGTGGSTTGPGTGGAIFGSGGNASVGSGPGPTGGAGGAGGAGPTKQAAGQPGCGCEAAGVAEGGYAAGASALALLAFALRRPRRGEARRRPSGG